MIMSMLVLCESLQSNCCAQDYHESVVAGLVQLCVYKKDVALSAGETLLDLMDYCQRKILYLINWWVDMIYMSAY